MTPEFSISGKIQSFDISGDGSRSRSYVVFDLNFATFQKYFAPDIYDVEKQTGEQREPIKNRVNHLIREITNDNYTPESFAACVVSKDQVVINKGKATIKLDENNKLPILNGFQRYCALSNIAKDKPETARKVGNLPIPLILHLDPARRKTDFLNLNNLCAVNKSQMLSLKIDQGLVDKKKEKYFRVGRNIALHLHKDTASPFHRMITFGGSSISPLSFSAIATDRKSDGVMSLFYSSKILEAAERSEAWFYEQVKFVDNFIRKNTTAAEEGNLLCVNGARGCSNLLFGVINQWCYYLYLHSRSEVKQLDTKVLKKGLAIFENSVSGDLSSKRRKDLMREFGQILFESIAEDENSCIGCHFGIPLGLLVLTSGSCFGVDTPSVSLGEAKFNSPIQVDSIEPTKLVETDTDEQFAERTINAS